MATSTSAARDSTTSAARVTRSHPFTLMRSVNEEMDPFFRDFGPMRWPPRNRPTERGDGFWVPRIEVLELDGRVIVRAEVAGLSPTDLKVEVRTDALIISGERNQAREEREGSYHRSERAYGRFERTIALPASVRIETAKATFNQGLLEVSFGAVAPPASRTLPIEEKTASAG